MALTHLGAAGLVVSGVVHLHDPVLAHSLESVALPHSPKEVKSAPRVAGRQIPAAGTNALPVDHTQPLAAPSFAQDAELM